MSAYVHSGFDAGAGRYGPVAGLSRRGARLLIVAAGCALMALSGVSLGGYLQTPSTPNADIAAVG